MNNAKKDSKKEQATLPEEHNPSQALDDVQRVKVLSPMQMVIRRFLRNKLAITGMIILVAMFIFSFILPLFSPYTQSQTFTKMDGMLLDYAQATINTELRYTVAKGMTLSNAARAQFVLAIKPDGSPVFHYADTEYEWEQINDDGYLIKIKQAKASYNIRTGDVSATDSQFELSNALAEAFKNAVSAGQSTLTHNGVLYYIVSASKFSYNLCVKTDIALATLNIYDPRNVEDTELVGHLEFKLAAEMAIGSELDSFTVDGQLYTFDRVTDQTAGDVSITILKDGVPFAAISRVIVKPIAGDIQLPFEFIKLVQTGILTHESDFEFDGQAYTIRLSNQMYNVKSVQLTELLDMYSPPSKDHILGTDSNAMDMLTRLMYGGRVSLMVGFIVVFIELFIGVIIGGVSGYFGGVVDTVIMRFIDLFNCIPPYPMMIIIGSIMDAYQVTPQTRIFLLMIVLGIIDWPAIARIVRGQILSLREQEFMVATEATGIKVRRRIFRHLVPNVMPQLIVNATMNLGIIIIYEATLSFLGLGVKYPLASWGSIINYAQSSSVLASYWWQWLPAGLCILLTVLGFNFVGDGLRDAFDPKMKR